jgi:hypothetical protein
MGSSGRGVRVAGTHEDPKVGIGGKPRTVGSA